MSGYCIGSKNIKKETFAYKISDHKSIIFLGSNCQRRMMGCKAKNKWMQLRNKLSESLVRKHLSIESMQKSYLMASKGKREMLFGKKLTIASFAIRIELVTGVTAADCSTRSMPTFLITSTVFIRACVHYFHFNS